MSAEHAINQPEKCYQRVCALGSSISSARREVKENTNNVRSSENNSVYKKQHPDLLILYNSPRAREDAVG